MEPNETKTKPKNIWYNLCKIDSYFKKFIILILLFAPVFIGINFINTYNHEMVHKQIYIYNGCNKTSMVVTLFNGGYIKCLDYDNTTTRNDNLAYILHSQNEIIAYNNISIIFTMALCTLIICAALILFTGGKI